MKCGRPKWMLRQLFQVFFLSILLILVVVAVLAYLVYFLPAYPPIKLISSPSSYLPHQFSQRIVGKQSAIANGRKSGGGGQLDSAQPLDIQSNFQDLQIIPLETAPIRHVSKNNVKQERKEHQAGNGKRWQAFPVSPDVGGGEYKKKCSMFNCFDIHRCGGGTHVSSTNDTLSIYIYPIYQWIVDGRKVQSSLSREFYQFLESLKRSPYYVSDPNLACIFVPSIDLLNLNKLDVSSEDILAVLSSLEFWGQAGQNHLLLTMFPGNSPLLHLKTNAIIASSGLFSEQYRVGFHVPVISPSPLLSFNFSSLRKDNSISSPDNDISNPNFQNNINAINHANERDAPSYNMRQQLQVKNPHWVAVAVRQGAASFLDLFNSANHDNSILLLDYCHKNYDKKKTKWKREDARDDQHISYFIRCTSSTHNQGVLSEQFKFPQILRKFDFCLIIRDLANPLLWEVMSEGCIPVIIADHQRLPFDEFIDWRMNSIQLYEHQIHQLSSILSNVSNRRRQRLKAQVQFTFEKYFKDMNRISATVVKALNARVFTHYSISKTDWNLEQYASNVLDGSRNSSRSFLSNYVQSPLFNPVTASKDSGFTAVILAYDRVASLFSVIQRVSHVPSLAKILVIWNNQLKDPPTLDSWPKVGVPVKIIKAASNKMSNRFFPYDEIETEAVFSLDDDIVMLTVDEMEFGFETWREYPDRIVGFPSRSHVWDNSTRRWKYESEWTSEISMVLTGASFYHKYWHHAYTNEMPRDIREWVDSKMNCEDIAMNFLVAASTGKAPIKVSPRKKFKCPTCSNNEMLSSDSGHMMERTDCINKFTQIMGFMPLLPTEFRADPVLYKVDGVPKRLKQYHDMGTL